MSKRVGQGRGGSKPCPRSLLIEKICRDCAKNLDPPCTLKEFAEKYSPKELMEIAASELKKNNLSFTIAEFRNNKRRWLSLDEDVGSSGGSGIPKDGDLRGTQLAILTRTSGGLSLAGGTMPLMPNALMGYANPNFMPNANLMGNGNPNFMGVNGWGGMGQVPPHQAVALYQQGGMMAQHPNNASHPTPQHQQSDSTAAVLFEFMNKKADRDAQERKENAQERQQNADRDAVRQEAAALRQQETDAAHAQERKENAQERQQNADRDAVRQTKTEELAAQERKEIADRMKAKDDAAAQERKEIAERMDRSNEILGKVNNVEGKVNEIHTISSSRKGPRSHNATFHRDGQSPSDCNNGNIMDAWRNDKTGHDSPLAASTTSQPNFDAPGSGQVLGTNPMSSALPTTLYDRFRSAEERMKKIYNMSPFDQTYWQASHKRIERDLEDGDDDSVEYPELFNAKTSPEATKIIFDSLSAGSMDSLEDRVLCLDGDLSSLACFEKNEVKNDTSISDNLAFDDLMRALFLPYQWRILLDIKGSNDERFEVELQLLAETEQGGGAFYGAILEGMTSVPNIQSIRITPYQVEDRVVHWNVAGESLNAFSQDQTKGCKFSFTNIRFNMEQCRMLARIQYMVSFKNCEFVDKGKWLTECRVDIGASHLSFEAIAFKKMNVPMIMILACSRLSGPLSQVCFEQLHLNDNDIGGLKEIYKDDMWSMEEGKLGDKMPFKKVLWFDKVLIKEVEKIKNSFVDIEVLGRTLIPNNSKGYPCAKCKQALQKRKELCLHHNGK